MQGFFEFDIVVASVPQSNTPNPVAKPCKVFFPVIGFVRIAVDMILFYFIMQLRQNRSRECALISD